MKKIELSQGKEAIVDDEEYEELNKHKWHYAGGYARRNIKTSGSRKTIFMHGVLIGKIPKGKVVDHINGDTLDNRRANLRVISRTENAWNARKRSEASSIYKGVFLYKRSADVQTKWKAKIQVENKTISLGYYQTELQAAKAYNEAAKKFHGEFAVLNDIESMSLMEYQELSSRTVPKEKWFKSNVSNFCMGLAGESGEVIDYLKKVIYHDHELDREKLADELGDVLWYLTGIATAVNIDLDEIARHNVEKLKKRYPDGFNSAASINRIE